MSWLKELFAKIFGKKEAPAISIPVKEEKPIDAGLPPGSIVVVKPGSEDFNAPWVFVDLDILGSKEDSKELAKRLVPFWRRVGLSFSNLIGTSHAWCQLRLEYALDKVGLKGTGSAGASKSQKLGTTCPYWFGAILPITHQNGNHHVNIFLYWENEIQRIACTMDGNRDNTFGIFLTDISGRKDKVVPSPRWPLNTPSGVFKTKAEVLMAHPYLKPGSTGTSGSTR